MLFPFARSRTLWTLCHFWLGSFFHILFIDHVVLVVVFGRLSSHVGLFARFTGGFAITAAAGCSPWAAALVFITSMGVERSYG